MTDSHVPLVPEGGDDGTWQMVLRRGRMGSWTTGEGPKGRILVPEAPLWIDEECVPAEGLSVQRRAVVARDARGRLWTWVGRRLDHEPTPPTPPLAFDRLRKP